MPNDNTASESSSDEYLSAHEAADFLGITTGRLERLRKSGKIPATRDGWFSYCYNRKDLMTFAERLAAEATGTTATSGPTLPGDETSTARKIAEEPGGFDLPQIKAIVSEMWPHRRETESADDRAISLALIVRLVDGIFQMAIEARASEIHVEPEVRYVRIRIRVDSRWIEIFAVPKHLQQMVFNRIIMMAGLNLSSLHPQTGTIAIKYKTGDYACRISCIPADRGENINIRILRWDAPLVSPLTLGISALDQTKIEINIVRPGLFLMAGPAGSGTTTTAYCFLNKMSNVERYTITFEEEPTYSLRDITQMYKDVRHGRTLANLLPVLLDHNPNVLFLGDIDDEESAKLAVLAAEQGGYVWATLHALDAISALLRLKSLGISPKRIAQVLNVVTAQRLMRRNCHACKTERKAEKLELQWYMHPSKDNLPDPLILQEGMGCEACQNTGYHGQIGIFEVLQMTRELRDLYIKDAEPEKLVGAAERDGMTSLRYDFAQKTLLGITNVKEGIWI